MESNAQPAMLKPGETLQRQGAKVPRPLRLFFAVAFLFDVVGLGCEAYWRWVKHLNWPYKSPVLDERLVVDLVSFTPEFGHLHTLAFFGPYSNPYMYPAPVAFLYSFFLSLPHNARVFQLTLVTILVAVAVGFGMALRRHGLGRAASAGVAGGALLLSYPAWFELRQGNMELFVCLLIGAAIWLFVHDRLQSAAVLIGVAAAMKIFPIVYAGLYLARRRYRPLGTIAVTGAVVTLLGLVYLTPSLSASWHGVQQGLKDFLANAGLQLRREAGYDHSLFALIKVALQSRTKVKLGITTFAPLYHVYLPLVALAGVALFFLRIVKLPVINQVLCLCVASVLLPPVSHDYTLLNLYVPWALLVFLALRTRPGSVPGLTAIFLCLAAVTSNQTELIHHGIVFGGQFKALVLLLLFGLALRYPLRYPLGEPLGERTKPAHAA